LIDRIIDRANMIESELTLTAFAEPWRSASRNAELNSFTSPPPFCSGGKKKSKTA
jgi:hypothetical protein